MPTSSIFKHFEIPADRAEEFINMLDESYEEQKRNPRKLNVNVTYLTDPDEVCDLLKRMVNKDEQ